MFKIVLIFIIVSYVVGTIISATSKEKGSNNKTFNNTGISDKELSEMSIEEVLLLRKETSVKNKYTPLSNSEEDSRPIENDEYEHSEDNSWYEHNDLEHQIYHLPDNELEGGNHIDPNQ